MDYSSSQDDGPLRCFNGAKSWQTGWYNPKTRVINAGDTFEGNVYGIADYSNPAASVVLVKKTTSNPETFMSLTTA